MSVDYRHRTRGALRLALSISALIAVAPWMVGCGEPRSPVAVGSVPELRVEISSTGSIDLAEYFSDPDGDELSYAASSSDDEVATVAISGGSVAVTGVASGRAEITVTASDDGGLAASQDFIASVLLADREVLEILYDELGGDGWADNTNWKTDKPLDDWYGVSANADDRVDTLRLRYNFLTGAIPSELGDLSNLRTLSLRDNYYLTGAIPPELGSLRDLEHLHIGDNSLTGGEIPSELGDLSNLEGLDLRGSSLTGAIPPWLGDLSNLEWLSLHNNSLTGAIPSELGSLSNLERLSLGSNSLTGEIPSELGDLSSLEWLSLSFNSLTGEIPLDFLDLSLLKRFSWYGNDGLCAPDTIVFDDWLDGIDHWGPRCD